MAERIDAHIAEIRNDSVHGATFLTKKALAAIREAAVAGSQEKTLRKAALQIAAARPMMASLFNVANGLLFQLDEDAGRDAVIAYCDAFAESMDRAAASVLESGIERIAGARTVLTHSYSSLVCETLLAAAGRGERFRVVCTESRPGNEGVALAERVCKAGIETSLAIDASAGFMMQRIDLVLLGADGVGRFGLVHKMGTYPIALAARESQVPFVSLATSEKFWPAEVRYVSEPSKPSDEIGGKNVCFDAINLYFDVTPLRLVDTVVTEESALEAGGILDLCGSKPLHPLLKKSVG
ncbi:translation initiation factor eIF-2B [Hydrogenimonas urashimensis]|uniref:translation initiation factor eIF-2B n=1 Tax=Hydrogenimonas urashimensis TaxID=2740515 RepID=UPI00191535D6|nr:hypothetical protein [Hydrogenimonas urashimensis]